MENIERIKKMETTELFRLRYKRQLNYILKNIEKGNPIRRSMLLDNNAQEFKFALLNGEDDKYSYPILVNYLEVSIEEQTRNLQHHANKLLKSL